MDIPVLKENESCSNKIKDEDESKKKERKYVFLCSAWSHVHFLFCTRQRIKTSKHESTAQSSKGINPHYIILLTWFKKGYLHFLLCFGMWTDKVTGNFHRNSCYECESDHWCNFFNLYNNFMFEQHKPCLCSELTIHSVSTAFRE